jgi:hypothetical protein
MIAIALLLCACAGSPRPGQSGYPYNVRGVYSGRLLVEGEAFDAELELSTALGGGVRGSFRVRRPLEIDGRVEGAVIDELLRVTITYRNAERSGCAGRIEGILTVEPGGDVIEGPATISDCGDALPGRMSFRR